MELPFTLDEFLAVFRAYNESIGPMPLVLAALGIGVVALVHSQLPWRHVAIGAGLAGLWAWSGIAYHWLHFARINPAARLFGALFVLQGVLVLAWALRGRLRLEPRGQHASLGWLLVAYALLVYPLLGWMLGHGYPAGPSFGAPCPTTIFFIGTMFWSSGRIPAGLIVIPVLWAVVATSAAIQLGIWEDLGLTLSAATVLFVVLQQRRPGHRTSGAHPRAV